MTTAPSDFFVSTEWLAAHLNEPDLVVVDGSFFMPDENRNAQAEYLAGHIPGAVFFDIDVIADHSTDLPHMLPSAEVFAKAMHDFGINETMRIVVYDASGIQGVARVWWTLRLYGAKDVKILSGGLPKWKAEGRPRESGAVTRPPQSFKVRFDAAAVASAADVLKASQDGVPQIVDARSAPRFKGEVPEPRPGLRSGHIPGSLNVPYREVIENGEMRSPSDVAALFTRAGVDLSRPIITSCGSGVTAAILLLALETTGKQGIVLYDGSWTEWGGRPDLPIAQG
ncbi:MAG: 3-mercaptopyruvate sulfurtransferase [Methylovirgula sp.]